MEYMEGWNVHYGMEARFIYTRHVLDVAIVVASRHVSFFHGTFLRQGLIVNRSSITRGLLMRTKRNI